MALTLKQLTSGPVRMVSDIVDRYHLNPDEFTEEQAKKIARLAFEANIAFRPQSKALEKFVFDLTDTALLGLIPNTLRPTNVGEDYFGETESEKFASGAGSLLGLAAGIGGAFKLGKAGLPKAKSAMSDAVAGFKSVGKERARRMNPFDLTGVGNVGVPF